MMQPGEKRERNSLIIPPPKKKSKFVSFLRRVFVKDWEIKLAAILGGFVLWLIFSLVSGMLLPPAG